MVNRVKNKKEFRIMQQSEATPLYVKTRAEWCYWIFRGFKGLKC